MDKRAALLSIFGVQPLDTIGRPAHTHYTESANRAIQDAASPVRLLIADDHALFRRGLVSLFAARPDFEVVGEAENGAQALEQARTLKPDIAILDVRMPVMDGLETLRRIRAEQPDARVVMVTASEDDKDMREALQAGARAYIVKTIEPDELFARLHEIMCGETGDRPTQEPSPRAKTKRRRRQGKP